MFLNGHVFRQEGYDEAFLKDAVLERMKDDVPEVVQAALKALEVSIRRVCLSKLTQVHIYPIPQKNIILN